MDRSRNTRKEARRAAQQAAIERKNQDEDGVFWREVRRVARHGRHQMSQKQLNEQEKELFSQQGTAGINFEKYDSIDVSRTGPGADQIPSLEDFAQLVQVVPPFLGKNIQLMRYSKPTPIQKHAIMISMYGIDTMCCAQTGSGKTCAFLLPIVASFGQAPSPVHPNGAAAPRALVLAPTRELALQINLEARKLTHGSLHQTVCVYGGANARSQLIELARGVDILVATPGRLTDFVDRGLVTLSHVHSLCLDEADRMLDMGFEPQIRRIVQKSDLPARENRQTMMFSATFPPEIQRLAGEFMRPYVFVAVGRVGATTDNITQRLIMAVPDKREKLQLAINALGETQGRTLIFVQKKRDATWVKKQLDMRRIPSEDIHGDRLQAQREQALALFREGKVRVLVATDVAARGLDIPDVTHVINFDLPPSPDEFDSYVHRIGRTGRAGNTGLATSLYVPGFADRVGNGRLWPCLHQLLTEAKQQIPDWFMTLNEATGGRGMQSFGGRGGQAQRDARPASARGGGGRPGNFGRGGQQGGRRNTDIIQERAVGSEFQSRRTPSYTENAIRQQHQSDRPASNRAQPPPRPHSARNPQSGSTPISRRPNTAGDSARGNNGGSRGRGGRGRGRGRGAA